MKNALVQVDVSRFCAQKVDYNKQFLKMVRINIMLNDGGV